MSVKCKKLMKERKYFSQHDDILESNIPYGLDATKSPHIVLYKWYHQIKNNCILLKLNNEFGDGKNRKIFYNIMEIGSNVKLVKKQNFTTIKVEGSKNNKVILLTKFKDLSELKKLCFYTEVGNIIHQPTVEMKRDGYVILATIQLEPKLREFSENINANDLLIANKYLRNQVVNSKSDYHLGTTGTIHGFGFGPVYSSNAVTQHSIDKIAKSKFNFKFFGINYINITIT